MSVLLCPQEHFKLTLSCLVHGDSSGAGGSSCCGHGGHSSRLLPCRGDGGGRWGTLCGPLTPGHAQKKPQPPSEPRRASGSCGLSCPVCLAPEGFPVLSCLVLFCVSSPGGLLIPPNFPREIFFLGGGGKRVPAVGAGPRGPRPRPRRPSAMASRAPYTAMASWAPCTAMASRAPSSAMVPVCLFHSGGPRPEFLSVFVLRGLQSAHPPLPDGTVKARDEPFGRGELCQGSVVCVMCSRLVSIYGLFPVLVSCHYELSMFQLCLSCYVLITLCILVLSFEFDFVWSTRYFPGVSCPCQSCLVLPWCLH